MIVVLYNKREYNFEFVYRLIYSEQPNIPGIHFLETLDILKI